MTGRFALIVANDKYQDPQLKQLRSPLRDAEALERVLSDPVIGNFEVQFAKNQPEHQLRRQVNRFLANRRPEDTLLLHFSCHGLKDDNGQLFFAASDTEVDHLEDSALDSEWLRKRIDDSRSKKIVVLLDCCFSGAFNGRLRSRGGDVAHPLEALGGTGTAVITATNALQYAYEGDTPGGAPMPSVFTSEIVRGLETGEADRDFDKQISIVELYDYVCERIRDSGVKQTPRMSSDVQGELIVANTLREPPPLPLRPELEELLESSFMKTRMAAIDELSELLRRGGRYAMASREGLERLRDDPDSSRRVSMAAADALAAEDAGGPAAAVAPLRPPEPETPPTHPVPAVIRLVHEDAVLGVGFSPDGRRLTTACRDQSARVWNLTTGTEERRFAHEDWVIATELSPIGDRLATACRDGSVSVWHVEYGDERIRMRHDGVVWAATFSPDGRMLATAGADATVRLWDVDDGSERESILHGEAVVAVRFSADGRLLATAGVHGTARVWDLATMSDQTCLAAAGPILAVSFDSEQRAIAACGGCDTVRVLSITDGREHARLDHGRARAVAFDASGQLVATAADDGTARLWDVPTGTELGRIGGCGRIRALALTSDGQRVGVAGGDRVVRVWDRS